MLWSPAKLLSSQAGICNDGGGVACSTPYESEIEVAADGHAYTVDDLQDGVAMTIPAIRDEIFPSGTKPLQS